MSDDSTDPFPVMERMTVKMVRGYLARKRSVILPIGVIEQHGYHLPLRTDALIAEHLAWEMGRRLDILAAPVMYQSFSGGGLPGTINISPAVMSLVVSDTLLSLASQGFRNFYLLLCHGGSENARALDDALKMLLRTNPAFAESMVALLPVWEFPAGGIGWDKAVADHDWHAGWLETSLVMAIAPELVRTDEMELDPEPLLSEQREHPDRYQRAEKIVDDPFVVPRMTQRPEIEVGVMGAPAEASAELGRRIIDATLESICRKVEKLEAEADGTYRQVAFEPGPLILKPRE